MRNHTFASTVERTIAAHLEYRKVSVMGIRYTLVGVLMCAQPVCSMVKSIGDKSFVCCIQVVHYLEGPLLEVLLYFDFFSIQRSRLSQTLHILLSKSML